MEMALEPSFLSSNPASYFPSSLVLVYSLSHIQLFVTPWTAARQAPLSLGNSPGKNTGVDYHALLQGIFPTQGSNPGLPH